MPEDSSSSSTNNNNSEKAKEEEKKKEETPEETPAERLVRIARLYYFIGFAFLPWMWFANALMLFQYRNRPRCPPEVVYYRNWSAVNFCISALLFALYVILARTALVDSVPWIIKPGDLGYRQNGLFSSASLVTEQPPN